MIAAFFLPLLAAAQSLAIPAEPVQSPSTAPVEAVRPEDTPAEAPTTPVLVEYPAREVLAAFATACSGAESPSVNFASAEAAGWELLGPDADTPVTRLAARGKEAIPDPNVVPLEGREYRKTVTGRTLYLAISGVTLEGSNAFGCRVFDFDAPRAPTVEELKNWSVRDPSESLTLPGGVEKTTYNPGLKPGHISMEFYYVPKGANPLPGFDLGGLTLVASVLEL